MRLTPGRLHASTVRLEGCGVLILGGSGTGKSGLALHLMALGAALIADDAVDLDIDPGGPFIARPKDAPALIEVRGVGLLRADCVARAPLSLVVNLDRREAERLPPGRTAVCGSARVPLFHNVTNATFPMAIRQYLLHGSLDPDT